MQQKFQKHIYHRFPYLENANILIALSGGVDSMVLTHLMKSMHFRMVAAFVNFKLRGKESDDEEVFVRNWTKENNIKLLTKTIDTKRFAKENKLSIQVAARKIRYAWFAEILQENNFDFVLTAHHLDDSIESFLINLNRGTGIEGLKGIPERNNKIIRPLLQFSRNEILTYAKEQNLTWREDSSNLSDKYTRNYFRHRILPEWEKLNKDYRKAFTLTMKNLQAGSTLLADYIKIIKKEVWVEKDEVIKIDLKKLEKHPHSGEILYQFLKDFGFTQWEDIVDLQTTQTGKFIVSPSHQLTKDRSHLLLTKLNELEELGLQINVDDTTFKLEGKTYKLALSPVNEDYKIAQAQEVFIDFDKLKFPLSFRKWQEGDTFYPLGMKGSQKLSNFYVNQKVALPEKEKIWLLCDADNRIVWVVNYRLDDRFKISKSSRRMLHIF